MHIPRPVMLTGILLLTGVLSACDVPRSEGLTCPGLSLFDSLPVSSPNLVVSTQSAPEGATVDAMIDAIDSIDPDVLQRARRADQARAAAAANGDPMPEATATSVAQPIVVRVLTLSAGGQWGAFGAGLMTGWSQNRSTPRPDFDIVTGVSAGAVIGTPVFAGQEFDEVLQFYRGLDADDVAIRRPLTALLRAASLSNPSPVESFFRSAVTPELVASIARRHAEGDQLLVAATNLDTTVGEIFDLGATAEMADTARAQDCIVEALLASSAIPGLLPPRAINGSLYADGGLRDQVFLSAVDTARARVARESGRDVRVEAYVIVNDSLTPPMEPPRDRLLDYIGRSVEILADEGARDSIVDAVTFAESRPGWTVYGMIPDVDLSSCGFVVVPTSTFDPCLTRLAFDAGLAAGRAEPIDWMTAAELRAAAQQY